MRKGGEPFAHNALTFVVPQGKGTKIALFVVFGFGKLYDGTAKSRKQSTTNCLRGRNLIPLN